MHVSLMQRIDYWCGIPLCAVLSLWHSIFKILGIKRETVPKKILFIELSEMGSAIIAYSSLVRAKVLFPEAQIYFLIFQRNRESVDVLNLIPKENVIVIGEKNFLEFTLGTIRALLRIWRLRIDTCIDLELFSRCTSIISYISGAANRVGFDQYTGEGLFRGTFLTHRVVYNSHHHMALNFLSLVYSLVAEAAERPLLKRNLEEELVELPRFAVTSDELAAINRLLVARNTSPNAKIVIVNPDPGLLPLRGWAIQNFVAVCKQLCERHPEVVIGLVGLPQSRKLADSVLLELPTDRRLDLIGATANLRELMVLFSRSALLITNDSGPAHFAALTEIPSIVLFGPETPILYAPLSKRCVSITAKLSCSPCFTAQNHRKSICTDNRCLQAIPVNRVLDVSSQLLSGGGVQ